MGRYLLTGKTEIAELQTETIANQKIVGFYIAMDNSVAVQVVDGVDDLFGEVGALGVF